MWKLHQHVVGHQQLQAAQSTRMEAGAIEPGIYAQPPQIYLSETGARLAMDI